MLGAVLLLIVAFLAADMHSCVDMLQFKKLEELEATPANNIVDVIGIVEHVEAWTTITRKDGTETQKRSVTIKDKTNRSIEVPVAPSS